MREEIMNKLHLLAMVTGLGLLIAGSPAWALTPLCEPPGCNPVVGDVDGNTAGGANALLNVVDYTPTVLTDNTAFGNSTLQATTSGYGNTAIGGQALNLNTTGNDNTAIGILALLNNTAGGDNTAIGAYALFSNTGANAGGGDNTAIGADALYNNIGSSNTAIGRDALYENIGGDENTAIGKYA